MRILKLPVIPRPKNQNTDQILGLNISEKLVFVGSQSDQIGRFSPIGQLLEGSSDFLKRWSSSKKWLHFGLHFASAIFLHFHIKKEFQYILYGRYIKVSKVAWCRIFWTFKLSFDVAILAFCGCNCFESFLKYLAFFQLVTLWQLKYPTPLLPRLNPTLESLSTQI